MTWKKIARVSWVSGTWPHLLPIGFWRECLERRSGAFKPSKQHGEHSWGSAVVTTTGSQLPPTPKQPVLQLPSREASPNAQRWETGREEEALINVTAQTSLLLKDEEYTSRNSASQLCSAWVGERGTWEYYSSGNETRYLSLNGQ